ncbi:hypothetical protein SASPL_157963 [Salvia splendens]|uniref:Protein FLOWERING LOCUS T n=2 Tax=Salvia splendens TaxID=180675 RepID=A0A8X8VU14_SALSN|nr:hypothetical protein SASPL_157963 [Salvia splendens]
MLIMIKKRSDPLVIGKVVGEVVDSFSPTAKMSVIYNSKNHVYNGHHLLPSTLISKPKVLLHAAGDFSTFFTLIMTDPDVPGPSDPFLREHVHWIVTNIPGSTDSSFGREVVSYEMPRPNIGIHRLVFILYKQKKRMQSVSVPLCRDGFCSRKFSVEHELGQPVAALFFNCQRETAARAR